MMGAMSKWVALPLKALEAEAWAVQEGVQLAWELGLREIIIKGDAQVVIKALQNSKSARGLSRKLFRARCKALATLRRGLHLM